MRWPVLLIGAVLVLAVIIFAISYNSAEPVTALPHPIQASTTASVFGTSTIHASGVQGMVKVRCAVRSPICEPQERIVEAYQGISSVGLFKTSQDGAFKGELPPGHYELRVATDGSMRCVSVGVVVQENAFISTNLSCEAL